jgi:hypothetical protein
MYNFDWKQERIDGVVREIERKSLQEIAMIVLTERFHRKAKEYEVSWLDELANALRDGDSFSETDLYDELMGKPKKELVKRYKNA